MIPAGGLSIGLVGCGRAAQRLHLPALARCPDLRLVAIADRDQSRIAAALVIARQLGFEPAAVSDMAALARLAEAAIVATPPASHLEVCEALAGAGVRCLVEKPPAPDGERARKLAALAPAVRIGFNRRFVWSGIAERLASLEPGFELEGSLEGDLAAWRAYETAADALTELGCHLADLAMVALGDGVVARCDRLSPALASFSLESERGIAVLRCDGASSWRERIVVRDGRSRRAAGWRSGGLRGRLAAALGRSPLAFAAAEQLRAFAAAEAGGSKPASAAEGVRTMAALDAVRASAANGGQPVEVLA